MSASEPSGSCSTSSFPLYDEQLKLHLANTIVDTINKCLLNKLANSDRIESRGSLSGRSADGESTFTEPIKDFKRLGAYCTLRPEQRRKYLLKALPTLRKSRILQTLLTPSDARPEGNASNVDHFASDTNDITNLERLIVDCCHFSSDNANNAISLASKCGDSDAKQIFDDPDRVEDCLRELDVYLEQIDHNYATACGISSTSDGSRGKNVSQMKLSKENANLLESSDGESGDDLIGINSLRLRELSSSDSKLNECDSCDESSARQTGLLRGQFFRRTFATARNASNRQSGESHFRSIPAQNVDPNWRRLSMRKTKPIRIPQASEEEIPVAHRGQTENEIAAEDGILEQHYAEPFCDELIRDVSSSPAEQRNADIPSFDSELLDVIMSSPETDFIPATSDHVAAVAALGEPSIGTDNDRPRQMGRRSEQRSRIVSITAERSAAGNQVIDFFFCLGVHFCCDRINCSFLDSLSRPLFRRSSALLSIATTRALSMASQALGCRSISSSRPPNKCRRSS